MSFQMCFMSLGVKLKLTRRIRWCLLRASSMLGGTAFVEETNSSHERPEH